MSERRIFRRKNRLHETDETGLAEPKDTEARNPLEARLQRRARRADGAIATAEDRKVEERSATEAARQQARKDAEAKAEAHRIAEQQRLEAERKAEAARQQARKDAEAKAEADRIAEQQRMEAERKAEQRRLEAERQAEAARQQARKDAEAKAEADRIAEQQRMEAERKAEQRRLEAERQAEAARQQARKDAEAKAEADRIAEQQRLEAERKAEAARQMARRDAETKAEADRIAEQQRLEAERKAEAARQQARKDAEAKAEADRIAEQQRLEAERKAEAARQKARKDAEAKAEADRIAEQQRMEAERKAEAAQAAADRMRAEFESRIEARRQAQQKAQQVAAELETRSDQSDAPKNDPSHDQVAASQSENTGDERLAAATLRKGVTSPSEIAPARSVDDRVTAISQPEPSEPDPPRATVAQPSPAMPALALRDPIPEPAKAPTLDEIWAGMDEFDVDERALDVNRIITASRKDPAHASFDVLRTRLLQALADNGWRRVAITSPTKDCGKTFTAANLAISLSRQENCRTLLMDMDLRNPSLHKVFRVRDPGVMGDLLRGDIMPERHFQKLGRNSFHGGRNIAFGFNGAIETYASELLQDPSTAAALRETENRLKPDVVLFDLPPALYYDDVIAFRPQYDGVLLVVGGGLTTQTEIKEVERRLGESTPLLGVILNKAEDTTVRKYSY